MATILDTRNIPQAQRVSAWISSVVDATVPSHVEIENPEIFNGRVEWWPFGRAEWLRTDLNTGQRLVRTAGQARQQAVPTISISLQERGVAQQTQFGTRDIAAGQLGCTDLTAPYEFTYIGSGSGVAVQIPTDDLALPMDVIRRAGGRLEASSLYGLVRRHIADVAAEADHLNMDPAAPALGSASIELVRALLASAAQDSRAGEVLAETLLTRIRAYVRQHLSDPDLRADRIAAAHHISQRHLYRLCSESGFSLAHWIMKQRLSQAYRELASPEHVGRSINMIALGLGFADASHFSRRFKEEFGMAPRERRLMVSSSDADDLRRGM